MNPKAVVFDLDGTLADTVADIAAALNDALATRSYGPVDEGDARLMIGKGPKILVERALRHLGIYPASTLVATLTEEFVRCYARQGNGLSSLFDSVAECLDDLSARGIPIGVCSNKPHEFCVSLLSDLGVVKQFDAIQGSSGDLPKKPDPTLLHRALEKLGVAPENALYVGDSETDVRTARAAGVPVALVEYGYSSTPVQSLGADWVIASLDQLATGLLPLPSKAS
jgi:phosphoglycolate phosphatase